MEEKPKLTIKTDHFSQQTHPQEKMSLFTLFGSNKKASEIEAAPRSAPVSGFMMPTALSIQSTFEGVSRRRSMSYKAATYNQM
ncbi:hypothetical protein [Parasitella parasitica]|uniref:Uncharacterized protein n=1 Tax=Parasitella parasitica TaxID=35722 RepID=A0A0B7NQN4_9FUNG|nr:hypothetical protein [Parasitella parasitica]